MLKPVSHKTAHWFIRYMEHIYIYIYVSIATGYGLDSLGIESRWGAKFSTPVQTSPGAHPASSKMGTGSFLGVNSGQGVTLTPHPRLVPWSRKSRAIPLLPLWAIWSVQSLGACTREHFTFFTHTQGRNDNTVSLYSSTN